MTRTARNLITAFCCTGLIAAAGCSNAGELSVTGMYGSQGQALSGDRCDELLMDAADANSPDGEDAAKEAYRECVENALNDDGQNGECRDHDDETCDIILDEVGDALHRIREASGQNEAPDCANAEDGGQDALCHLMAAYEACELDRDNDGDPDVEPRPDNGCDENPDGTTNADQRPECGPGDPNGGGDTDPADCDQNPDGTTDADNRPGCGDSTDPNQGGETDPDGNGQTDPSDPNQGSDTEPGNADAFCQALQDEIANCNADQECAELEATRDRECRN